MAYPKPLSQKSIDKMLSSWKPKTIDILHKYYKAFADLYGYIQLKDAWSILKKLEPSVSKKEFINFSSIVRREDVSYYVYEIDELYSAEKRKDTDRIIVHKSLVGYSYYKFADVYHLDKIQRGMYYDKSDLLKVAEHPLYDKELKRFIDQLSFVDGVNKGKQFKKAIVLTKSEEFDLDYYKTKSMRDRVYCEASLPLSEKFMNRLIYWVNFGYPVIKYALKFLEEVGYTFANMKQAERFTKLVMDFNNKSHTWRNRGYSPDELYSMHGGGLPKSIEFGSGFQKAFADGIINRDELVENLLELGIDVIN